MPMVLQKIKKKLLTPEEKKINALVAAKEHRARLKSKGYRALQVWVPGDLYEDVRKIVKEMVTEFEKPIEAPE